jgi:excisionase family DNA binding protein
MTEDPAFRIRAHPSPDQTPVATTGPLLSPDEVADFLGIPVKTLYQWRYKRVGPQGLRIGRHLRDRPADVDAWLREVAERGHHGEVA